MRLITHNMLSCSVKGCTKDNFPLVFKDVEIEIREAPENLEFIRRFLPKLEWDALVTTAQQLGDTSLPLKGPETDEEVTEDLLRKLHHALLEVSL
jgi:multifunctional methyltransferase subunit TRM112